MKNIMSFEISSSNPVRYIKLGTASKEAEGCFEKNLVYIGFGTEQTDLFAACTNGNWDQVKKILHDTGSKKNEESKNILKRFFEDDGQTIWVTFAYEKMWWCYLEPRSEFISDERKVYKKVKGSWSHKDINGNILSAHILAGDVTQTQYYRGTSIEYDSYRSKYIVTKINGKTTEEVNNAKKAQDSFKKSLVPLVKRLHWKDFELMVELIFSHSGWRRISATGGTEKFHDGIMEQPAINETAALQVKSRTTQEELEKYIQYFQNTNKESIVFDRLYYVYHTGNLQAPQDKNIHIWDIDDICEGLFQAGLTDWLIKRVE